MKTQTRFLLIVSLCAALLVGAAEPKPNIHKWMVDTDDQGRRLETLEELQAGDRRFDPAVDWRPAPGTHSGNLTKDRL